MGVARRRESTGRSWENLGTSFVDNGGFRFRGGAARRSWLDLARRWWWQHRILVSTTMTVLLALALGGLQALESFSRLELPPSLRHPLVPILLTTLILWFAFSSYTQSRRSLVFYRRFVRPGLGELLGREGETLSRGEKLFRGREVAVMKVDVEGSTFLTYDMPYGMRRLYLDLWYTLVDGVLAKHVFFDKSLGDGSFYVFDAEGRPGACRFALAAAMRVRDETVPAFDRIFRERLADRLERSPQLRIAAELYFERYRDRAGADFWSHRTEVRIALVAGCVDEGLWGLSSQSHYDVQGTPLVLASRLEQAARSGEILLDRSFLDALERETGGDGVPPGLVMREIDLRGIGPSRIWVVCPRRADAEVEAPRAGDVTGPEPLSAFARERGRTGETAIHGTLGL